MRRSTIIRTLAAAILAATLALSQLLPLSTALGDEVATDSGPPPSTSNLPGIVVDRPDAEVARARDTDDIRAVLLDAARVEGAGTTDDDAEKTPWWLLRPSDFEVTPSQLASLDVKIVRPPEDSGYVISDPIPATDIPSLQYTSRDWSRWDSFDIQEDLMFTPTPFASTTKDNIASRVLGITNGGSSFQLPINQTVPSSITSGAKLASAKTLSAETYHSLFKAYIETTLYPRGYSWFKSSTKNPTDWIKTFKSSGLIPLRDVLTNASYALNENYNVFRTAKRASLRSSITAQLKSAGQATDTATVEQKVDAAFDALKIDWLKDMPRNKKLVEWYEMLLDQIMAKQSLSHAQTSKGGFGQPYDSFGLFLGFEYDPTSYDINLYHFHAYEWGLVASRYVKLLSTGMIRKVRKSIYASLAPQYFVWQKRIGVEDARTNQWIMRVIGWTTHAYFALKSEAILRARGVWDDATDGYYNKVTDWPNGRATNSDLLKHAESVALRLAKRTRMVGMTEYLATYYGLSLKCISETIMLSPSQVAYDALETVYKTYWYDLAGNFFSSSSFISGPTGRHYDLFLGSVTFWENWLRPLYAQHFFQPACAVRQTTKNPATGASVVEAYNGCIVGAPVMQPGPTWVNEQFEMEFMHHAVMQAAGYGYLPYDVFVQNNLGKPYRSLWGRFSLVKGQERYNFITPTYQIGTGGEDATGVPFNNVVNARLTGSAVKGAPVSVVSNSWNSLAPSMVRMFVESNDQPFTRPSTYAVAGKDVQEQARYVNVQYQSFMLTTSFVSGRPGLTGSDSRRPWNTNLVLPLAVDALYADTTRLPTTAGSVVAIPPGAIITVRHGSASIVLRVLRLDADAPIKTASKVTTLSSSGGAYDPGVGKQEHSMTWVVDKEGITSGVGRIVIHHTHRKDSSYSATPMGQWRVATLWAAGRTPDANSMEALQRLVRQAKFTESITNSADWKPSDQPWSGKPKASWDGKSPMGTSTWRATVSISGVPTLKVERQDVYQPNSRDAVWSQPSASPFNVSPYYLKSFSRTIDDKEMFDGLKYSQTLTFDDSAAQAMIGDTPAFFTVGHKEDEILEPHLAKPSVCRPGIDFPCYQWMTSGDTGSGTCTQAATDGRCGWRSYIKSGATVKCVDASSQNKQVDDSLCDSTKPSTVTCNSNAAGLADASSASSPSIQIGTFTLPLAGTLPASGACLPSRPTNVQATVVGATARVTWSPPNQPKEGAQESQNYYVLAVPQASPGKLIAVMSRTSPTSVPLPLGVLYKFRVAGENSAGVGEWSDRSNALSASSSSSKFLAPSAHALLDENGSVTINFQTDESAAGYLALLQPISGTASSKVDDSVDLYSFSTDSSLVIPEAIRATTFKYAVAKVSDTGNVSAYSTPLVASQPGAASKLPVSAIAGIVIGGLVGTGVLAVLLAMLYRRHREEKVSVKGTMVPQQEVAAGATGTKAVTEELHHVHIASVASPKYGKVGTNEMRQPLSPRNMQPSESAVEPFASPAGPVSSSQHQKNYPVYMPVGPLPSPSPSPSPSPTPSPPPPIRFRGE